MTPATSSLSHILSPSRFAPRVETLLEKGSGFMNEDAQLLGNGIFGVFDGATSLSGTTFDGVTGGFLASNLAVEAFAEEDRPLRLLAARANDLIRERMVAYGVDLSCKEDLWSTSVAAVKVVDGRLEWCQTGDCRIQLIYGDGTSRQLVEPPDHDAETLKLWQKLGPVSRDPIHIALADKILKVRRRMNVDYGVLNGEPEALDFVRSGTVSLSGVEAILLYTDGLHVPDPDSGIPHAQDILSRLFTRGGLNGVHQHIRMLQDSDPACIRYPRFKFSDDISAIALYQ